MAIRSQVKFVCNSATAAARDCTGEPEGCSVVWISHTDTETPFELREKERDDEGRNSRGDVFSNVECVKVTKM